MNNGLDRPNEEEEELYITLMVVKTYFVLSVSRYLRMLSSVNC